MRYLGSGLTPIAVVLLVLLAVTAQAMPEPAYLLQDDFTLSFGEVGNPLAAGTTMDASGRLVLWNAETFAGSFVLSAVAPSSAVITGSQWNMNFKQGTFKITDMPNGNGVTLWEGVVDYFHVTGNIDDSRLSAAGVDRPAYESEPSEFNQLGTAKFVRTGGQWTDHAIGLEWAGTYNINYDASTVTESSMALGNLQGKLVTVPEPSGLLLIATGVVSLVGTVQRRRTR